MQPDYNLEFAHIYADEEFGLEQLKSLEVLKKVISKLKKENKTFVTSILIDEFHPVVFRLDENKIIEEFKKHGIVVDFIGYESKLGIIADKILKELPKSMLKLEHFHKPEKEILMLKENNKKIGLKEDFAFMYRHTCALLSCSWSLCRLGIFKIPKDAIRNLSNANFDAKRIITILPEKYRVVEDKIIEIIKSSKYKKAVQNIEYEFFEI
ncbi:MAG: hypothetical protein PHT51_02970 [Patescibacteria group bacterium]|nr:hypothetical protein [Patescibacteria group bacterium]MDD4611337.1 hypothetical protein [Patescibacteria group bacterium]